MARKKTPIHICIDRILPFHLHVKAADIAAGENIANRAKVPKALDMAPNAVVGIAILRKNVWENGRVLNVKFLDGDATQRKKVEARAHAWEDYANIKFKFGNLAAPEIRISFKQEGSWSAVGTDALVEDYFKPKDPTMNFGWLTHDTEDEEYDRVVLHEFGHALGAIHEHSSPSAGIKWNKPAVYRYFGGPPNNWSKAEIDQNIIDRYSRTQTNFTAFDPKSIMLYSFPAELTLDGHGTESNSMLSRKDKEFMAKTYPKAKAAGTV
jgi:hypothetical protein